MHHGSGSFLLGAKPILDEFLTLHCKFLMLLCMTVQWPSWVLCASFWSLHLTPFFLLSFNCHLLGLLEECGEGEQCNIIPDFFILFLIQFPFFQIWIQDKFQVSQVWITVWIKAILESLLDLCQLRIGFCIFGWTPDINGIRVWNLFNSDPLRLFCIVATCSVGFLQPSHPLEQ